MKPRPREAATRLGSCALFALAFLSAPAPAAAQIGSVDSDPAAALGTRVTARNTVQGSVAHPSGRRFERRVKVVITSSTGQSLQTSTDDQGNFIFRRLAGGSYFLMVDAGEEFEKAHETVDIFTRGASPVTVPVYVQLRYKRTAERRGTLDAALAGVPQPAVKHYEKAVEAVQLGNSKKAVESLKKAVELYPDFALAYNLLGVEYLRLDRPAEATDALRQALRLTPGEFGPLLNYGVALFFLGQHKEAGEQLRRAIAKQETSATAHFFLGRVLIKERQYAEAEKELQRAVSLGEGEVVEAHRYLGGIYREMGDHARAVESLEKYLKLQPRAKDAAAIRQIIAELRAQPAARP